MSNPTALQQKAARKALVIEDEGEMGLLLNIFLDEKDFELDYVKNLESAEQYLEKQRPAIVILDNRLPDGFGVDFIGYIKKKYEGIKVIMISGYSSAEDVALENGADAFLEKPFSRDRLYQTINDLLQTSASAAS